MLRRGTGILGVLAAGLSLAFAARGCDCGSGHTPTLGGPCEGGFDCDPGQICFDGRCVWGDGDASDGRLEVPDGYETFLPGAHLGPGTENPFLPDRSNSDGVGLDDRGDPRVEVHVPADLPLVDVDPALTERALANVIANALVVQPPTTPVLVDAAVIGDRVHVRVIDHGPGIPPADRVRVRSPFQRMGDRSNQAGVGLGLAIAHGFALAVGGHLEMEDTPGGGLTAVFELPVADNGRHPGIPAPTADRTVEEVRR